MASGIKFDLIDFLKLAPKYFLPLLLFSGLIIFIPNSWVGFLNLETIILNYRWVFSLIFIFSFSMFLGGILLKGYELGKNKIKNRRIDKHVKHKLNNLSNNQRNILLKFINDNVKSVSLPLENGEVADLVNHMILYRATSMSSDLGMDGYYFDYCLQPGAEKIVKKNKKIIMRGRKSID